MASKRSGIGGAGTGSEPSAQEVTPEAPEVEQPKEETPNFDHLWGAPSAEANEEPKSNSSLLDKSLGKSKLGGTPQEDTATDVFKEPKFQELAKTTEALKNFATSGKKTAQKTTAANFVELGGVRSLKQDALDHHLVMFDLLDNLSSKIQEMRRTHPLIDRNNKSKRAPTYDLAEQTLVEAAKHLAQAGIEHNKNHFGVAYLDKSPRIGNTRFTRATAGGAKAPNLEPETGNMPVAALGYGSTRSEESSVGRLRESIGQESSPLQRARENIAPNGAIGLTEAAKEKMLAVTRTLQQISDSAKSSGWKAPEFDSSSINDAIKSQASEYALKIDASHLRDNPDREEPLGSAVPEYRKERADRLSNPDVLEGLGETSLAENRRAGIKSMFDRKDKAKTSLDQARAIHLGIQRTLTRNAFLRVFGKKLSENKQAISAITAQRTPLFQDNLEQARLLSEKSREQGGFGQPIRDENTNLVTGVIHELPTYSLDARTGIGAKAIGSKTNPAANELLARAQEAISKAKSSGDDATAAALQEHVDTINHHLKGARLNENENSGAFGTEGANVANILGAQREIPDEFRNKTAKEYAARGMGSLTPPKYNEDETRNYTKAPSTSLDAIKEPRFAQTVEDFAPALASKPGEEFTQIASPTTAEQSSTLKHSFYSMPVVENGKVREGKNDAAIEAAKKAGNYGALQRLYAENREVKESMLTEAGNPKKELKDADAAYLASRESSDQKDFGVQALKKSLAAHHSREATASMEQLRLALKSTGNIAPDISTPGKAARIEQPELPQYTVPHPELFDSESLARPVQGLATSRIDPASILAEQGYDTGRRRIAARFADVAGLPTDIEGPNLDRMETNAGTPMDYKQARKAVKKGGRKFAFGDALGHQYEYGRTFIPDQITDEQDFYNREARRNSEIENQTLAQQMSDLKATVPSRNRVRQEIARNDRARQAAGAEFGDLAPLMAGSGGFDQRGWLLNPSAIQGKSGKEAIIPGVGIVPLNGQPVSKVGKEKLTKEEKEDLKFDAAERPKSVRGVRNLKPKEDAGVEDLDVMDLSNNVRGGRQFRDYSQEALKAQQEAEEQKDSAADNQTELEKAKQERAEEISGGKR